MNLIGRSVREIQNLLKSKEVSAHEIAQAQFAYAESADKEIRAFNHFTKDLAFAQAKHIDELIRSKQELPPLAGVPVSIKDNMCVSGYPTACGSKILENYVPTFQSTAVEALFDAGALCIGKSNLDEFAMGSSTENSAFEPSRNPWNTKYVPGGSSGGSAAAVAAGFTTIALGSDTGGSVRQPASFCGIVGMKPTYGLVSRFGLVAFASSLDQIGPFARSVADVAITLAAIAVHDPKDSTSLPDPTDGGKNDLWALTKQLNDKCDLSKMKIGIIEELSGEGNEAEVRQAISNAADVFTKLGAKVDPVK